MAMKTESTRLPARQITNQYLVELSALTGFVLWITVISVAMISSLDDGAFDVGWIAKHTEHFVFLFGLIIGDLVLLRKLSLAIKARLRAQ
ncbi:hypothetical protein MSSD14B_22760 [Marinobacter salsuginis]|jgi:hypothetical protein|uniref:Uncharacterized protein n=1 Tax=Marinobacter salsuginis TaxID=418719 RepID=A0A5M3Q0A9_9GAMM|nr:hypothetical protein MSSD14B_22760 [Marinobacter salsuginis]